LRDGLVQKIEISLAGGGLRWNPARVPEQEQEAEEKNEGDSEQRDLTTAMG